MLLSMLRFEWRYYLRQPSFYVVSFLLFLMSFLSVASNNIQIGSGGEVLKNSPFGISQTLLIMGLISMFAVVNFVGSTAIRNHQHLMEELIYSKPLSPFAYQFGRFLGSFMVVLAVFAFVPIGLILGSFMPWVDGSRFGPFVLSHYLIPYLQLSVPSLLLISCLFYAMASRFRSLMALYLTAVAMLVLYTLTGEMASQPQYRTIAALLDPFALRTFAAVTRYWTISEKNHQLLELSGLVLQNRALWLAIACVLLALSGIFRQPTLTKKRDKKSTKVEKIPELVPLSRLSTRTEINARLQFWTRVKFEVKQVLFTAPFLVLGVLTVFNLVGPMFDDFGWYGTSNWPLTQDMVDNIAGATGLLMVIVLIYYSAEIVWRERTSGMGDIVDSAPVSNLCFWASKLVAVLIVMTLLYVLAMSTTIVFQLIKGQGNLEISQYLIRLGFYYLLPLLLSSILAFFLQVLSPNKYAGMGLFVAYYLTTFVMANWGFGHSLYNFAQSPSLSYSDMNGYGWGLLSHSLYMIYWGAFSLILFVLGYGLYHRGPQQSLKTRLGLLGYQLGLSGKAIVVAGLVVFIGSGSYLFYQTKVVNHYLTQDETTDLQADYEKTFKQYQGMPILVTTKVNANIDIFPEQRKIAAKVMFEWQNKSDKPIEKMLVQLPEHTQADTVKITIPNATLGEFDRRFRNTWLSFSAPVLPGQTVAGNIELVRESVGIAESGFDLSVVENGTFINNLELLPLFGYQDGYELMDRHERQKRGLTEKERANKLEDSRYYRQNFFGVDGDFIQFEATVSTSADQIALAPGYLQKQWQQDGRQYFHYLMDSPMVNFYAIISGRYQVEKVEHNGIAVEVYYHVDHPWNVARMVESVKDSIDYYTAAFGPYQHKQMRIMEFPGYRSFAQSFANTVPYSERIGFITDLRNEDNIDPVYYVTAHEVAHQWWGHQVGAADVQGSAVISESLSQYSALMVLEHKYGDKMIRKFLKYELDRYLRGRSSEPIKEQPLLRSENQQYIHYQKGSVVMMAIKDVLGEAKLNANLKAFLTRYQYRNDPFPTTVDLVSYLKLGTDEVQSRFIDESFNDITLYDLRLTNAVATVLPNGKTQVELTIYASRKVASGKGEETEQPLDMQVDIGAFSVDPDKLKDEKQILLLEKHHLVSGENKLTLTLDEKPSYVGVDPFVKLIDRDARDNIFKL
ncbi:ABC transporter permease/M1 family aminopeptidase [Shewanella xiamenensis]|uniref:ABC transporter permease/M1 family aminopeptidase n=1 Tax=Shewanella xiamenensis TaxID=332186 RepID=UPI0035B960A7